MTAHIAKETGPDGLPRSRPEVRDHAGRVVARGRAVRRAYDAKRDLHDLIGGRLAWTEDRERNASAPFRLHETITLVLMRAGKLEWRPDLLCTPLLISQGTRDELLRIARELGVAGWSAPPDALRNHPSGRDAELVAWVGP